MFTSDGTIKWIESLAEQESLIHQGEKASLDIFAAKDEVLQYETASFLRKLESYFESLTRVFNGRLNQPSFALEMQKVGDGSGTFSIQRNQMRLTVTQSKPGTIQFLCDKISQDNYMVKTPSSRIFSGIVEASFVHFNEVVWQFLGSAVEAEKLSCHYLTEFLQVSRGSQLN